MVPAQRMPHGLAAQVAPPGGEPGRAALPAAPAARRAAAAAAPGDIASQRPRQRTWIVAVITAAALLGIAAGTVLWAPWARHQAPRPPTARPTSSPPPSAAVLAGTDAVHYKNLTLSGLDSTPKLGTDTWSFTPKCATGPCSVNLVGAIEGVPFTATLRRSGAAYRGKTTLQNSAVCASASYASDLTIQVKVRAGRWTDRRWLAASWTGRLMLYSPSTAKCRTSRVTADIYSNSGAHG
jgi:hypothetical protein